MEKPRWVDILKVNNIEWFIRAVYRFSVCLFAHSLHSINWRLSMTPQFHFRKLLRNIPHNRNTFTTEKKPSFEMLADVPNWFFSRIGDTFACFHFIVKTNLHTACNYYNIINAKQISVSQFWVSFVVCLCFYDLIVVTLGK